MKAQSNYFIVQTSDNDLWYFFYSPDKNICYSICSNKQWSEPITVIEDVNYNFSLNLSKNDDIYVFCQDLFGNVILCLYQEQRWSFKKILENKSSDIYDIGFQMIFDAQSFNLIYSMPIVGENSAQLVYHSVDNSKWSSPQILDNIIPFKSIPFILQKINSNLYLAFYEKQGKNRSLGYREFSTVLKRWGKFNPSNETLSTYLDQSFLSTDDTIHTLYILKNNFSYQLVYKYKKGEQWSVPYILYENNKIDICSLFMVENQLWIVWCVKSYIYTCISYNMGKTFSKANRYTRQNIELPVKALFLTNKKQKQEKLYIKELLLYNKSVPKILFIPELYSDFYGINSCSTSKTLNENPENIVVSDDDTKQQINILRNKISTYEKQLSEKEGQIALLIKEKNLLLQTKNILENQIAQQGIELSSLQTQLEDTRGTKKTIILPNGIKSM